MVCYTLLSIAAKTECNFPAVILSLVLCELLVWSHLCFIWMNFGISCHEIASLWFTNHQRHVCFSLVSVFKTWLLVRRLHLHYSGVHLLSSRLHAPQNKDLYGNDFKLSACVRERR